MDFDFSGERSGKLENGASLITFSAPQLHSVAFSVVLPFLPDGTPGVYHLIEHMFFERAGARRAEEINAEMTSRGSEINGYTSINYMCFNFCCRKEVFVPQLHLLRDMLTQREYGQEELERCCPSSATRSLNTTSMTAGRGTFCANCGSIRASSTPCSAARPCSKG